MTRRDVVGATRIPRKQFRVARIEGENSWVCGKKTSAYRGMLFAVRDVGVSNSIIDESIWIKSWGVTGPAGRYRKCRSIGFDEDRSGQL